MSVEIQCMTEKLIVITIKLDYSKVPSKSTVPTYAYFVQHCRTKLAWCKFKPTKQLSNSHFTYKKVFLTYFIPSFLKKLNFTVSSKSL